jgi:TetR/AcrR family transcriptional regulator
MPEPRSESSLSRREERRVLQQDISRSHLLDAAELVFGLKGYYKTTLKEVAELAEYSVGSVYSFFENKDDLFGQIFVRRGEEFMPLVQEILVDDSTDPVAQLHAVVDFEIGFFRENPRFGRLYLRYANATMLSTDREIDLAMRTRYEETMRLQARLFERGQRAGVFRSGDPEVLARLLSGLVSAYQALDPMIFSDEPHPAERMPLDELHEVVEAAFVARARGRRSR